MKRWAPIIGAVAGCVIGFAIGWVLASDDIGKVGDFKYGAMKFIGGVAAVGIILGYFAGLKLSGRVHVTRDGFMVSYQTAEAQPEGYRAWSELTIENLVSRLEAVGYAPALYVCNETGERTTAPASKRDVLVGTNFAIVDPGVRGWVRVELPRPMDGVKRAMGLVEIWSETGYSAEELAKFVLRSLGEIVDGLKGRREQSTLSEDSAATLTEYLPERPQLRRAA